MLSWIVLIVLMGLFGVVFFAIFASVFGRGEQVPPMDNTVNVNAANLAAIKDNNLDEIKFATVLRGYRQDQVVIDALLTEIAQLRKQVAEINSTPQ